MTKPTALSLLLITSLTLLAYAPLIPFLGFYSEDFFFSYVAHFYGSDGLIKSLSIDRPFNGYLLSFLYFTLGLKNNVFLWHLFALLIRLIGGYALFFTLLKIWPKKIFLATSITLLFLTYPGFLQQTLPLGYSVHIITLTSWVISLLFSVLALKANKKFQVFLFTSFSLILVTFNLINLEFFIGMEIFRFLIITYILKINISINTIKKTYSYYFPYIFFLFLFVFWRIFIFKSTRPETDIKTLLYIYSDPIRLAKLPLELIISFINTTILAYFLPAIINFLRLPTHYILTSISLGIFSFLILYFYFKKWQNNERNKFIWKVLFAAGLISVIFAIMPVTLAGRPIRVFNALDRYTIIAIIPLVFVISSLLYLKSLGKWILIILISFSISSHFMNAYWHKVMWDRQIDLWWQLYWRAPNIKNNTMLILDFPEVSKDILFKDYINKVKWYRFYWVEEQIWTAGNLFLNYNNPPKTHIFGDFLADKSIMEKIKKGAVENFENRGIHYTRNFGNALIIKVPSDNSCLHVQQPSSEKLIGTDTSGIPPVEIFGREPEHTWCYYFQKASLARQLKDWDKLEKIKKEVMEKSFKPSDPNEWLIFTKDIR